MIALPLLLVASGDPSPPAVAPGQPPAHRAHDGAHHGADPDAGSDRVLPPNEGARWQMDDHTRAVFAEIRASLSGPAPASLRGAHALVATLEGQLDRLIEGCTMGGPAHDELHVFLTAWMPAVAALRASTELTVPQPQARELQAMVVEFDRVFE